MIASLLNDVGGRCVAAYLGDIALTEDELELIGVGVTSKANSVGQKPSAVAVPRKPPPSPPVPLQRLRDGGLERRVHDRRQRRRRRRKHWRVSSSDMVNRDGKLRQHNDRADNGRILTTAEHKALKRRGNRHHRQSAEQSQYKRYIDASFWAPPVTLRKRVLFL